MRLASVVLFVAIIGASAAAATARFDSFPEGILGNSFLDGGITFFDFDRRLPNDPNLFVCEQADGTLSGPYFSPPNTLGFGGWVPGPHAAFSRVGSFKFKTGGVEDFVSLELFEWSDAGNKVTLEAYRDNILVASTSITLPGGGQFNHHTLSLEGVDFDTVRVNGSGPLNDGCFFGLVDNVVVTPEPAGGLLVSGALLVAVRARRSERGTDSPAE